MSLHQQHWTAGCLPEGRALCNSCLADAGRFVDMEPAHFWQLMSVNYMGVVNTLQAAMVPMVKLGSGRLVVSNSIGGYMGEDACCLLHMQASS